MTHFFTEVAFAVEENTKRWSSEELQHLWRNHVIISAFVLQTMAHGPKYSQLILECFHQTAEITATAAA